MTDSYNTSNAEAGFQEGARENALGNDFITVLTSKGPLLAKQWVREDGKPKNIPYDRAKTFDAAVVPITNLAELAGVLDNLSSIEAVIHGALIPELGERADNIQRLLYPRGEDNPATINEAAHHWVLLDVDGIPCPEVLDPIAEPERAAAHVISLLPEEFHGAAYWWQLTGSAGFKPGIRMRLAFWMDRTLSGRDVKIWLSKVKGLDLSIYTANQPIYAAAPLFEEVEDPVPHRSGICDGGLVSPPELRPALKGDSKPERWGTPQSALRSYRDWRASIGDHPDGQGFFEPIKSAIGAWVRANPLADTAWLREDLEKAIRTAPHDPALHDDAYIEQRVRDLGGAITAIAESERAKPPPQWVVALNERFAVVRFGGKVVVAVIEEPEVSFISKDAFFDMHYNKFPPTLDEDEVTRKNQGRAWFQHRHRREYLFPGVVFEPSRAALERPGALNLWRGYAVEPKQGDWSLMQDHILNILANGNEEHAEYIFNWMAYCVQHPEVPVQTALAFTGHQGSGKGVVWREFGTLFGRHFRHFSDPNQFTGKFNANLGKSVLVFLDEAIWGGNKMVEGKIKAMITEPMLQIEPKGIDSFDVPNRLSIVVCSNAAWSVPVGESDRRWATFRSSDRYAFSYCEPIVREAYFGPLYAQMEEGGRAAMLQDLLERKVTAAQIRNVPNTSEKARLKSLSFEPTKQWLEQILQEGEIPARDHNLDATPWTDEELVMNKNHLYDCYLKFCREGNGNKRSDLKSIWARTLSITLGEAFDTEWRVTLPGKRRGPRSFKFGPLALCRAQFDKAVGNIVGGDHWGDAPSQAARESAPSVEPEILEDTVCAA